MNSEPSASKARKASFQRAYEFAEQLNTSSALCIEFGQYHRAEISLTKALHLAKVCSKEATLEDYRYHQCTLDGCIRFTEESHRAMKSKLFAKDEGLLPSYQFAERHSNCHALDAPSGVSRSDSFIYKLGIRTPCFPVGVGYAMGPTLPLVITFNLALSKHLRAIDHGDQLDGKTSVRKRELLERSLRLYEVVYDCLYGSGREHGNLHNSANEDLGERFKMILCNNLCHVHRCLCRSGGRNRPVSPSEYNHDKYLEGLLSALMCVLQRKVIRTSVQGHRNNRRGEVGSELQGMEHEGFWKTVTHLILTSQCADAA